MTSKSQKESGKQEIAFIHFVLVSTFKELLNEKILFRNAKYADQSLRGFQGEKN